MTRFRKPELVPILFILAATTLLVSLGGWQLKRLEWKMQLLSTLEHAQAQPALTALPPDIAALGYRQVDLSGAFLEDRTFHRISGKREKGKAFVMLTPFKLKNDGRVILVNRGMTPSEDKGHATGFLRAPYKGAFFLPANQPEQNVWLTEDVSAMAQAAKMEFLPLIVETGALPKFRNDHLGYAFTWFLLAAAGLIMFVIYHRIPARSA